MALTAPEWLTRHDCGLEAGYDGKTYFVLIDGKPQYRLVPVPVGGKFSCAVTMTINGKRLDKGGLYPTMDEALKGGLEDLRQALGW